MTPTTATVAGSGAATSVRDRHVVLRHRLRIDGFGVGAIGGGFFLAVVLVTGVASIFNEVTISGWEPGTQLIRWFVGAIGVYLTAVYLPLYVTHGRTRREVAIDSAVFAAIYAGLVALLITVGFALERGIYRLAGWTQGLENDHLFDAPDQYLLILAEHVIVLVVWIAAGALLGAGFYRGGGVGLLVLPVGVLAVVAVELTTGPGFFGPLPPPLLELVGLRPLGSGALAAVVTSVVGTAVLAVGTWALVRDIPIRSQTP